MNGSSIQFPGSAMRSAVEHAAECLTERNGSVVLAPTETVYGLICAWDDEAGREKIYRLKHRPHSKLLAAFLPDCTFVSRFAPPLTGPALRIARAFMPGPITLVVPDGAGATFGFRIPDHPFIRMLLDRIRIPLASTSANLSGEPPALDVRSALRSLDGAPDLVVDGGAIAPGSPASTVVQVEESGSWKILRPGPIPEEAVRQAAEDRQ